MNPRMRKVIFISIVPLLIGLYFFYNINGYYRFKELCQENKQLVISTKLERDVGWKINFKDIVSRDYVFQVAKLPHIKFVRFRDWENYEAYDVRYIRKASKVADGGASRQTNYRKQIYPSGLQFSTS